MPLGLFSGRWCRYRRWRGGGGISGLFSAHNQAYYANLPCGVHIQGCGRRNDQLEIGASHIELHALFFTLCGKPLVIRSDVPKTAEINVSTLRACGLITDVQFYPCGPVLLVNDNDDTLNKDCRREFDYNFLRELSPGSRPPAGSLW